MGEDPASSVVDPELRVHDTPGLYVFGGAVFPTCHGVNPTLTMWALCYRAAERLAERLGRGEEPDEIHEKETHLKIEHIETAYYRLPLEPMGDAGHGAIDTEELITLSLHAEGLTGHGYAYTIGRGGRAVKALIDHDLAPLVAGQDATEIEGLWDLMWQRLLYVGRGGLASFAIAAVDVALWDLDGVREGRPLYALLGAEAREIPAYGSGVDLPKPLDESARPDGGLPGEGLPGREGQDRTPRFPTRTRSGSRAVRELIGDDVDLMVDANMAWTHGGGAGARPPPGAVRPLLVRGADDPRGRRRPRAPGTRDGRADSGGREPALASRVPALRRRGGGRGLADRPDHQRRHNRLAAGPEDGRRGRPQDQQPLHRRAERAPAVRLGQPGLPREARLRPRPVPARAAAVENGHVRPTETPGTGMRFDEEKLAPYRA